MNKLDYFDRILIKLRRQYERDEVISALSKGITERDIEIGQLKSEIDYLRSELKADNEQREIIKAGKIEARKDELYILKNKENHKLQQEIHKLREQRNDLLSKLYSQKK